VATPELFALCHDWPARVNDHDLMAGDGPLRAALDDAGVTLLGYRPLRELMRG